MATLRSHFGHHLSGEFGGFQALFEQAHLGAWRQDGCIGNYKPSTYKWYDDHVTNLVRTLFNQKVIKNFEDKDLVYTKKIGGKLAMHCHVTRRLSKHVVTFKRSEFSSLKKEQDQREGSPPHALKLQRTPFNRFATFGGQCIEHYSEVFKQVVPNERESLEDANVEFLLQLECAYSKNFELPFLKGTHQLGVVESNMYETWHKGHTQRIPCWLVNPIQFFPQFPSLSNLHKQWVTLYIECLHSVFQKHKLCIRAPTRVNRTNRFGETIFGYTRARLQQQEHPWVSYGSLHPLSASGISKIGCMGITRSMLVILENWLGPWTRTLS